MERISSNTYINKERTKPDRLNSAGPAGMPK